MNWSLDAQWVEAASSSLTVAVAAAALYFARSANKTSTELLQVEQKREDRAESALAERRTADDRGEQADQVWASQHGDLASPFGSVDVRRIEVRIRNASDLPVDEVWVQGEVNGTVLPVVRRVGAINPGTTVAEAIRVAPDTDPSARTRLAFGFRDMAGRVWHRHFDGTLELVSRP